MNIEVYPPTIEDFFIDNEKRSFDRILVYEIDYNIGISPYDPTRPNICYLNCWFSRRIDSSIKGNVFLLKTLSQYGLNPINNTIPVQEVLELLINSFEFFKKEYTSKTIGTVFSHYEINEPTFDLVYVQKCIDIWGIGSRGNSLN